jgi:hypothetical protein
MKKLFFCLALFNIALLLIPVKAQNPIVRNQFSADPTARVFNGRVYVFPSHDILAKAGQGRPNWFCMEDYHVFSSSNLADWTDHGVIVSQNKVKWVDSTTFSMWAPDCIKRNGKYYFYFPANNNKKDANGRSGFSIGVAIANQPEGPYIPQPEPITDVKGIDPNVFIDKDGQAYLYYASGKIFVAKLKANMLELDSEPIEVKELPSVGLKEGPFLFERNGTYYLTYPHVQNKIERLEYAISNNPLGPFKFAGVIMDESPMNCWTYHQSFIELNQQWYLFYHQNAYSPKFDKNRSICIDSMFFNTDGTIQKVKPTLRGVGLTMATQKIEIDRYSLMSATGASIAFMDSLNTFNGWKTILNNKNAWIQYNAVDFGSKKLKTVKAKVFSKTGGTLQIRLDKTNGILLAEVKIPKGGGWSTIDTSVLKYQSGIHNLIVVLNDYTPIEIDWIQFMN